MLISGCENEFYKFIIETCFIITKKFTTLKVKMAKQNFTEIRIM